MWVALSANPNFVRKHKRVAKSNHCISWKGTVYYLMQIHLPYCCVLNPIPTGTGRNQPIYEYQVTTAGRNRVKYFCSDAAVKTQMQTSTKTLNTLVIV